MRRQRPFLHPGKLLMDVPFYWNWSIPYISITLCWKVFFHFWLCCLWLFRDCGLYRLARMTFLRTASSFAQLSFCTFQGGAESVGGSWGIGCPRWWSHSASPLLDLHVGCCSVSVKRRKGIALQRPRLWLAVLPLSVQISFECIAPVPHTIEVPCVFGLRQFLLRRLPFFLNRSYHCMLDSVSCLNV